MFKKSIFLIFLILSSFYNFAQIGYNWAFNPLDVIISGGSIYNETIKVDAAGNSYITGYFTGTLDFDPGVGTTNLTSLGGDDIFFAKYNSSGNLVFAKNISGTSNEKAKGLTIDASGEIIITGYFLGKVDFDPGVDKYELNAINDCYLFFAKYDTNGNLVFAKAISGNSNMGTGFDVTTDASKNIYVTGWYRGTYDFNPSATIANMSATGSNFDIFIAKYNSSGEFIFSKSMGGNTSDNAKTIRVDASGNIYISGEIGEAASDFDPSPATYNLTPIAGSSYNVYIAKYDSTCALQHAKLITPGYIGGMDVDALGNIYIRGCFFETSDFNPDAGVANLTSNGAADIFIAKYNPTGNYIWAKSIGGSGDESYGPIDVDASGNIYTAGTFTSSTVDFNPDAGVANISKTGGNSIFYAKYNSNGEYVFAKGLQGNNFGHCNGIGFDPSGNIYIAGPFYQQIDFDPSSSIANLFAPSGITNVYLAKYNSSGAYIWAKPINGFVNNIYNPQEGKCVKKDDEGNIYITGYFSGTVDFDPTNGISYLTADGGKDIYFAKYNSNGNIIYAQKISGLTDEEGLSLAVDGLGNVYITGYFTGTTDFDPNSPIVNLVSAGDKDVFIAKYDATGKFVYTINMGGTAEDYSSSIVVDNSGNAYITGCFKSTADFDPSASISNLTSSGENDIFIAKYNSTGTLVYAKKMGGSTIDIANSIAIDNSNNICITGSFKGIADFDPSASIVNLTSLGESDIFIAKYNASGNFMLAKNIGGNSTDIGTSITTDAKGNIYITGSFSETADFNTSAATNNLISAGNTDIFVAKYDHLGNYIYAKNMGGVSADIGTSLIVDKFGNVMLAGNFSATADFNPNTSEVSNLISEGDYDLFVARYDSLGNYFYAKNIGSTLDDRVNSIVYDARGYLYITGYINATADFNPEVGVSNLVPQNSQDLFIAKLKHFPEIAVKGNNNLISAGSTTTSLVNSTYFGAIDLWKDTTITFTITNSGNAELLLTDIILSDETYFYKTGIIPSAIPIGDSAVFKINFLPYECGNLNSIITINNNDNDEGAYTFKIAGLGKSTIIPNIVNLPDIFGECFASAATPTASNECISSINATTTNPISYNTQGTFNISWTYNDGYGNIINQTQKVIIDDTTAPVPNITNLPDIISECNATVSAPTATDNCKGLITATTLDSLIYSTQGTRSITWTYDDGNGNTINQTQKVIINDTTAPVPNITNLPDIISECNATVSAPSATDNCKGLITATTLDSVIYSTQGTRSITWIYNDGNGNTINQTQKVIIDDTTAPVPNITNLPDIISECNATVSAPTATDNCKGLITATTLDSLIYSTQGNRNITWTYNDRNGNIYTQNQTVLIHDITNPIISCIDNQTINLTEGQTFYVVQGNEFNPTETTDNCDVLNIKNDFNNLSTLAGVNLPIGTNNIIWTITDVARNEANCNVTIQVNAYVGVKTISHEKISIYPNPTSGLIFIKNENAENFNIEIMDVIGNILITPKNNSIIDLSTQTAGVYFVRIITDNEIIIKKIIKK